MASIKRFGDFTSGEVKCPVCGYKMYATSKAGICITYNCSSDAARFWDFARGSKDQTASKKHWDESRIEICKDK